MSLTRTTDGIVTKPNFSPYASHSTNFRRARFTRVFTLVSPWTASWRSRSSAYFSIRTDRVTLPFPGTSSPGAASQGMKPCVLPCCFAISQEALHRVETYASRPLARTIRHTWHWRPSMGEPQHGGRASRRNPCEGVHSHPRVPAHLGRDRDVCVQLGPGASGPRGGPRPGRFDGPGVRWP